MTTFVKFTAVILAGLIILTGCQSIKGVLSKRDNGSLDYTRSQKTAPIALPAQQATAPFVPLYDVPDVPQKITPTTNDAGTQYQLPRPPRIH
ncbi:MAG: hypothetical protein Q4B79_07765 [Moraxella sp.]|uniref:hypothetical protein n=1 Tax=Moraxella sp. TaxID=479 RepID=UPI0026DB86FD|nr:hypothetical protein [Moraxella sp.]MDO4450835.1 hypothetical protein [Moraxella sp.]